MVAVHFYNEVRKDNHYKRNPGFLLEDLHSLEGYINVVWSTRLKLLVRLSISQFSFRVTELPLKLFLSNLR